MMVSNQGSMTGLLQWQARNVVFFTVAAAVAVSLHEAHDWFEVPRLFVVPALPVAVVGGALGIFVSFRTNSAYARWWEGRQLWGRLINSSRHWCNQVRAYVPDEEEARRLVLRQIAWVHMLRVLLRLQPPAEDADVLAFLQDEERAALPTWSNPTHALLDLQQQRVTALANEGRLGEHRLQSLDETLRQLLDIQGGCERIKKTPLPRGYGYIAEQLIRFYAVLLPLAIVEDLIWLAVPINVAICLSFMLISEAGRVLEDPFTMFWNGLPLMALSKTVERNLLERLGDEDLPVIPGPDANGILM